MVFELDMDLIVLSPDLSKFLRAQEVSLSVVSRIHHSLSIFLRIARESESAR